MEIWELKELFMHLERLQKKTYPLDILGNQIVGMDMSNYLMKLLRSSQILAIYFAVQPPLDLYSLVWDNWNDLIQKLKYFDITIIMVFDGWRNPAKLATNQERIQLRTAQVQQVRIFYLEGMQMRERRLVQSAKNLHIYERRCYTCYGYVG